METIILSTGIALFTTAFVYVFLVSIQPGQILSNYLYYIALLALKSDIKSYRKRLSNHHNSLFTDLQNIDVETAGLLSNPHLQKYTAQPLIQTYKTKLKEIALKHKYVYKALGGCGFCFHFWVTTCVFWTTFITLLFFNPHWFNPLTFILFTPSLSIILFRFVTTSWSIFKYIEF